MDRLAPLLLDVWREVGKHLDLPESAAAIGTLLARRLPLEHLWVRHLAADGHTLETVGEHHRRAGAAPHPVRSDLTPAAARRFAAWLKSGTVLAAAAVAPDVAGWLPAGATGDALLVPLGTREGARGVAVLLAAPRQSFDAAALALAQALRDPLTAALENEHRLREITALREAAEADRRSLLTRLGREALVDEVVGVDSGLAHVMERARMIAPQPLPVLILGDTGTGKELLARSIHGASPRAAGPFHRVNCGAIAPELVDSELFGHERGAFTGAVSQRRGWFERADGGTLFLDEVGELSPAAQVRLLTVVQDGWLERVGGHAPVKVDVRIIAATHRDLTAMVRQGRFREDLWYRLAVFTILLPPLKDRPQDIPALAAHFARRAAVRFGLALQLPTAADIARLAAYDWPGNIRELAAVIDRAAILGNGERLDVAGAMGAASARRTDVTAPAEPGAGAAPLATLDEAMRRHIASALAATGGRIEGPHGAAAALGINPHTLRARMRKLGVDWRRFRRGA